MKALMYAGSALALAIMLASPAAAQTTTTTPSAAGDTPQSTDTPPSSTTPPTDNANANDNGRLEDIVVIGRKRTRAEELQRTPVAITALGPTQLARSTVKDMIDVGRLTPNASLQATSQKGVQNFSIRGAGVSGTSPADEPAVGIFQDGVYWGSNYGALNELLDVEGVEILRGPQGTLFGRNVTGGAVTVRSARPSATPYGKVTLGLSNGLGVDASAVVNQPLSDTVAFRIAGLARYQQGLFSNPILGGKFGKNAVSLVRPSIKWTPSSNFDVTLLGEYYHTDGDPIAIRGISPNTVPGGPLTLAERAGYTTSPDWTVVKNGDRGLSNIDVYFAMGEINWGIGPGTLTSITGYRKVKSRNIADFDGFPVFGFLQDVATRQHQFSEELRYAADFGKFLSVTAGAYYFDQSFNYTESRDLNNHATLTSTASTLKNSSYAFFAEADVKPFAGFTLTLGGRLTHEEKKATTAPFGTCAYLFTAPCTFQTRDPYKANNFTPKVGISYQIDSTKLVYASFTKGFRSGGFSLRGTPLATPYQAEDVEAYEAGFKTDLFDRRVRFNMSGYYNKFTNLQRTVLGVDPVLGTIQSVFNAASATVKGLEAELTVIPTTGLTLAGNFGYTKAQYDTFAGVANPRARQFVRVPKYTANATADYEIPLANGDKVALHFGAAYTGRYYFDDPNLLSQPAYWLLDANIAYTLKSNLTITAYTRNLTNTKYSVWGSTLGALGQNVFPGDPRTYGVRVGFTF